MVQQQDVRNRPARSVGVFAVALQARDGLFAVRDANQSGSVIQPGERTANEQDIIVIIINQENDQGMWDRGHRCSPRIGGPMFPGCASLGRLT